IETNSLTAKTNVTSKTNAKHWAVIMSLVFVFFTGLWFVNTSSSKNIDALPQPVEEKPEDKKIVVTQSKPQTTPAKKHKKKPIQPSAPVKVAATQAIPQNIAADCPNDMVKIAAGTFYFGSAKSDPDRNALLETFAAPHTATSFCMDRFEYPNKKNQLPQVNVNFIQAKSLCEAKNKRLCNEVEWEHACKGPQNIIFPYGNIFDPQICNVQSSAIQAAGAYNRCKSSMNIFDLSGNVQEWVEQKGAFESNKYLVKGGSFDLPGWASRCAAKKEYTATITKNNLGFRCCMSIDKEEM
ncbi:MAG: SUMF1/EgtB/PvdO family nonheme iron enzyme, partial [Deltaproteobacteria bacterium]|nr:SUMF1/EgtB/PvdO family nonheme iron enzyme [Deltaproteobacteria bacterium]